GVLYTDFWQKLAQHIADTNPAFKGMTARQVFDKRVADIVPMKCEQTPEDIGNAAVFLASDEARYITGQALMVDGGVVMWECEPQDFVGLGPHSPRRAKEEGSASRRTSWGWGPTVRGEHMKRSCEPDEALRALRRAWKFGRVRAAGRRRASR